MGGLKNITGKEMENVLYPFFWQHGEDHAVLAEYMDKIADCGMKGVCIEARPHPDFVGDGWWSDMDLIIEKAHELGMKLWILDDSHFPTGFANGKVKECYPQYLKKYLDMRRFDVQGPIRGARVDFQLLKGRPWDKPDNSEEIFGVYLAKRRNQRNDAGDPVLAETFTDITDRMDMEKRILKLDVPAGAYSIFVVYQTRKGGEESTKDYLNPLVKEATQVLIDEVYEAHYRHYKDEFGTTIQGFFSDEPRFGNVKGTEGRIGTDMVLPWREGLEKELGFEAKYLPLLWVNADGEESQIRLKYMDTVTRLYNENFTKVIGDWCRARGVDYLGHTIEDNGAHARLGYGTGHFFRGQEGMDFSGIDVIGGQVVPGMNYHHDAFNTGGSNGEFYHYALAKLGTSAAHLDPKKKGRTMCEAFGAYGWNEGLKTMKWIADHLLVRGVNYIVPHAFDPKAFPDFDCPPHFYAHGKNPQFRYFPVFTSYVNRIASLFRGGSHPAKVGVFYPAELEWMGTYMPVEKPARVLTEHQISFDIVSLDYLKTAEIGDGCYTINGQTMEVLAVPYGEHYPAELTELLARLADSGVKVICLDGKPEGAEGEVIGLDQLGECLKEYCGIICGEEQPDLVLGEYLQDSRKYYMMFNENIGQDVCTSVEIPGEGYVYRYDAFADTLTPASHEVDLCLAPYESAVFVVSETELECTGEACGQITERNSGKYGERELTEVWTVRYADSLSYPDWTDEVPLTGLDCVENIAGWDNKCGTLRYETKLDASAGEETILDLGETYETAEVFVNGKSAGVRICKPYRFDLTGLLQDGENDLAVEVTNTLGTAVRDALSHYLVIEPFGVQGPARLLVRDKK